ncbi:MAG: adenylyl-sulfate kinase [Pseudonocardiales bacterium]|nr:adenylyl-sulfate kinase [Pseudonocardiales bacterium]MBV9031679.1 adenylyl-sulfate kinase [Pseudonocardiales bacterium]
MNGLVIWLTGLSAAGRSTIAQRLRKELAALGRSPEVIDGGEVRTHLSRKPALVTGDRDAHVARIGYLARLIARQGGVAIAVSPCREAREELRDRASGFVEIHVRCSVEELMRRDVTGLPAPPRGGITHSTAVDDSDEPPPEPEVVVDTEQETVEGSVARILRELERRNHIRRPAVDRMPAAEQRDELLRLALKAPGVDISARDHADLYLLNTGALSPLFGFMDQADYSAVLETGRLAGGAPFPLPVLLRVDADVAHAADQAGWLGLRRQGRLVGLLKPAGAFRTDVEAEAAAVYATRDDAHPGVRLLRSSAPWALAGEAVALVRPPSAFPAYDLTPSEVRAAVAERGWRTMVGFQTRNPVHRAHEYLHTVAHEVAHKMTLEGVDGLLLHPLVGERDDGIPADGRMRCYEALLAHYHPADRPLLVANPAWMRYAGPREEVFHALVRRNFGCTHFVVGRDHAGVGGYDDTHRIFDQYQPGELGIEILRFENSFCRRTRDRMASAQTWTDEFARWETGVWHSRDELSEATWRRPADRARSGEGRHAKR